MSYDEHIFAKRLERIKQEPPDDPYDWMTGQQKTEVILQLSAECDRLRRELDKIRGIIR